MHIIGLSFATLALSDLSTGSPTTVTSLIFILSQQSFWARLKSLLVIHTFRLQLMQQLLLAALLRSMQHAILLPEHAAML